MWVHSFFLINDNMVIIGIGVQEGNFIFPAQNVLGVICFYIITHKNCFQSPFFQNTKNSFKE